MSGLESATSPAVMSITLSVVSDKQEPGKMADHYMQCWKMFLFVGFLIVPVLGSSHSCEELSHPDCGVIPTTETIRNGKPVSYPWMVFLYLPSDKY